MEKIGTPFWYACDRRVENERPSWIRSTAIVMPWLESPGQEVAVHRVRHAVVAGRPVGREDRLREHLPAEDAAAGHAVRSSREDVFGGACGTRVEVEHVEHHRDRVGHPALRVG